MGQWRATRVPATLDEAVAAYRLAVRGKPEDRWIIRCLVDSLVEQDKFDEALGVCREAGRQGSWRYDWGRQIEVALSRSLIERGKVQDAISLLRERSGLFPDDGVAQTLLGDALASLGTLDEAENVYREAVRITSVHLKPEARQASSAAAHNGLGEILWKKGRRDQAISEFIKAKSIDEFFEEGARARENLAGAIVELRAAIQLRPDDSTLYYWLGSALQSLLVKFEPEAILHPTGQNAILAEGMKATFQVIPAFRKAIALDSKYYEAHFALGCDFT